MALSDPEPGFPPIDPPPGTRLVVRCTPEFLAWAHDLADHLSSDVSQLVECGLSAIADKHCYHRRIPRRWISVRSRLRDRRRS